MRDESGGRKPLILAVAYYILVIKKPIHYISGFLFICHREVTVNAMDL